MFAVVFPFKCVYVYILGIPTNKNSPHFISLKTNKIIKKLTDLILRLNEFSFLHCFYMKRLGRKILRSYLMILDHQDACLRDN